MTGEMSWNDADDRDGHIAAGRRALSTIHIDRSEFMNMIP
jgi:hypothetical protein